MVTDSSELWWFNRGCSSSTHAACLRPRPQGMSHLEQSYQDFAQASHGPTVGQESCRTARLQLQVQQLEEVFKLNSESESGTPLERQSQTDSSDNEISLSECTCKLEALVTRESRLLLEHLPQLGA